MVVFKIKKVINNNILCVTDVKSHEMIVTGCGIGFKRKVGETIDSAAVEKVYQMTNLKIQQRLTDLLEQIPYEHFQLTDELVETIRARISYPLNESLLITLADHISFAIKRKEKGMLYANPLLTPIREYYPQEYQLGLYCLKRIHEKLGVDFPDDEAGFIALHIVNAELNTTMSAMNDITRFVDGCVKVIESYYQKTFNRDSLAFNRLTVHLRFFAQRLVQNEQEKYEDTHDQEFCSLIARNCQEHYQCAKQVSAYVKTMWHKDTTREEILFLTIHLKRLNLAEETPEN
ncbi:MAG TPA: transcription antiterminator BglG [Ruminococcaceae bacterium]|nr:transcription antiterminator BglG [Oscillospiraceae bacterium]